MNRAVSQFSTGEYAGANNTEDDFAVMRPNGLPLRADDHGSSILGADVLGASTSYDVSGVIGTRTDTDVFAITLPCVTNLTVSADRDRRADRARPQARGPRRRRACPPRPRRHRPRPGSGSPPVSGGMDAQASVSSASGVYYLRVDGVGNGNPAGDGLVGLRQRRPVPPDRLRLPRPAHRAAAHTPRRRPTPTALTDADADPHPDAHADPTPTPDSARRPRPRPRGRVRR